MKKSQITILVLIGLVMLIFFVLGYLAVISKDESMTTVDDPGNPVLRLSDSSRMYIKGCLQKTAEDALYHAGKQGGVIYDYQAQGGMRFSGPPFEPYGRYVLPVEEERIVQNVSYGIIASQNQQPPPFYPHGMTALFVNPEVLDPSYRRLYGNFPSSPFTPLCDAFGKNSENTLGVAHTCESYDANRNFTHNSVQEYIEAYIASNLNSCIDITTLPEFSGWENESVNATITTMLAEDAIFVTAEFPAVLIFNEKGIMMGNFDVEVPTRLMLIHELISHLIEKDTKSIFFDILQDGMNLDDCRPRGGNTNCLKQGMVLTKILNPCKTATTVSCTDEGKYDDVLVVIDEEYKLRSEPYRFYIAIDNRRPALDLIPAESASFEIIAIVGDAISISPIGYDPDENSYAQGMMQNYYTYSLWKESYDETYDAYRCNQDPDTCLDPWNQTLRTSAQPRSFTQSADYLASQRNASYMTSARDKGAHFIKIEICDEENLCDYQILRVLVADNISSVNMYNDIPPEFASTEDPYRVVFPFSTPPSVDTFQYEIRNASATLWIENSSSRVIELPSPPPNAPPAAMSSYFPAAGNYELIMTAFEFSLPFSSQGINIQVKDCLPHRSSILPYPIDNSTPFLGNHTCCKGDPADSSQPEWGTLEPSTKACHDIVEYGCWNSNFTNYTGITPTMTLPASVTDTDVYKRVLTVFCSGSSGNTCSGPATDMRTLHQACGSCMTCTSGSSTCVPANSPDTLCSTQLKCSEGNGLTYNAPGKYLCKATCQGGQCKEAVQCACSSSCDPTACELGNYGWDANTCRYNCSGDCTLQDTNITACSAPNPATAGPPVDIDGVAIRFGTPANGIIENQNEIFASYCSAGDYCYAVSCNSGGYFEVKNRCGPPGTVDGTSCFVNPGPQCSNLGDCTNKDVRTGPLTEIAGNTCRSYHCDADSGWIASINPNKPSPMPDGHDNVNCHYGAPRCESSGWVRDSDSTKPAACLTDAICTDHGWECP